MMAMNLHVLGQEEQRTTAQPTFGTHFTLGGLCGYSSLTLKVNLYDPPLYMPVAWG